MKYGIMGGFIKFAFAKTAFDYIEKEIPEINMASYKKRVLKEYRAIVERTPGIGSMKDNMFVMTMYAGAFLIALYKEADGRMDEEKLKGLGPCGILLSSDGDGQKRKERFYKKGDRNPDQAGQVVQGPYRGVSHELVLLFRGSPRQGGILHRP